MKNPALARVFAIVLAVMCLVMLLAGAGGIRSAFRDKESDDGKHELMLKRIARAQELETLLAGTDSYDSQEGELDQAKEQHETDSSQHRTDLATYSATRGGTKMGADALWAAKAQTESARAQLETAKKQLETGEAAYGVYQSAQGLAGLCGAYSGELAAASQVLQTAAAAAAQETDPAAIATIMAEAQTNATAAMPNAAAYDGARAGSVALLSQLNAAYGLGFDPAPFSGAISAAVDVSDMAGTLTQLGTAQGVLGGLGAYLGGFIQNCGMDASTGEKLAASRAKLDAAMAKLEAGENEIQFNLEQIWWQNGELEKDAAELEERKGELESERETLDRLEAQAEEQKKNENEYKSLSVLLRANENISAAYGAGEDLLESAGAEAQRLEAEAGYNFVMRLIICALSLIGAAAGFLSVPAAFERLKSRAMLILPIAVCLLSAACAVALSFYIGRGALYSALFTVPFALIQLLIVIPKRT